jgi:uncharacterized OB-fold protein
MTPADTATEPIRIHSSWALEFEHAAGHAAERFLTALGDGVLLASPCPKCERVLCPPRDFCERCFVPTSDDWVEVGPEGKVEAFTVVHAAFEGYRDPPYAVAYVQPDGASTALGNFLEGFDLSDVGAIESAVGIGSRATAVFADNPQRTILDFHWEVTGNGEVTR